MKRVVVVGIDNVPYRFASWVRALGELGFEVTRVGAQPPAAAPKRRLGVFFQRRALERELLRASWGASAIVILPFSQFWVLGARRVRALLRVPIVSDLYVSIFETLVNDRQRFTALSHDGRSLRRYDRAVIEDSDALLHLNRVELEHVARVVGARVPWERVVIAPLAIPARSGRPAPKVRRAGEPFVLGWWGTFIPLHGLDRIIQAVESLHAAGRNVELHLFGPDTPVPVRTAILDQLARSDARARVHLHSAETFANGRLEPWLLENCDLALGIFGPSEKAQHCIPNKLVDALSMRIPVLTMTSPALAEFFGPGDLLHCANDPATLAATIATFIDRPGDVQAMTSRGYEAFQRHFDEIHFRGHVEEAFRVAGVVP